jgi:ATP-dependent DNA helicase RecQ
VRETDGGSRIVYVASRRSAEAVTAHLRESDVPAEVYHAGLGDGARTSVQDRFMAGTDTVLVATNAVGMGESSKTLSFTGFPLPRERRKGFHKQMLTGYFM